MIRFTQGDPAPWFTGRTRKNQTYRFNSVGGYYIVLCFLGSTASAKSRKVVEDFRAARDRFDPRSSHIFFVTVDPRDQQVRELDDDGLYTTFWDFDRKISATYGATKLGPDATGDRLTYEPYTLVLDTRLRVLEAVPFGGDAEGHVDRILSIMAAQPDLGSVHMAAPQAPVLVVPRVFSPGLCRALMNYYKETGSNDSGFMRERDGKTVEVLDHSFKRRRDCLIQDKDLRNACHGSIERRLLPQIERAFQFKATRLERYLVACYDGNDKGFFQPHRDNTTKGTAHRKFAVTINLNAEDYEGGNLCFREFGRQHYRAPTGGAVVFSCGMLHEATPVTEGTRFCFLPFLYDEAGAKLRQENLKYLESAPAPRPQDDGGATPEEVKEGAAEATEAATGT